MNLVMVNELTSRLSSRGEKAFKHAQQVGDIAVVQGMVLRKESRYAPYSNYYPICESIYNETGVVLGAGEIAQIFNS